MIPPLLLALPVMHSFRPSGQELITRSDIFTFNIIRVVAFLDTNLDCWLHTEENALVSFHWPLFETKLVRYHRGLCSVLGTLELDTVFSRHSAGRSQHIDRVPSFHIPRMMKISQSTSHRNQTFASYTSEPAPSARHFAYTFDF